MGAKIFSPRALVRDGGRKLIVLALALLSPAVGCGQGFQARDSQLDSKADDVTSPRATPSLSGIPTITSWSSPFPAGRHDPNCMTNAEYNICLIAKDPVSANGSAFSPTLTPGTSTAAIEERIMTIGLRVPTQGPLSNGSYIIVDPIKATPYGGSWKFPYKGDTNHYVAQIQAFYWLNRQATFMKEQTGKFYYENQGCRVTAYDSGTRDNAYYNGTEIVLGYRSAGGGTVNIGLDAAVIAHEAGHGNFDRALRGKGSFSNCRTKDGCIGGIHEGQSDVHSFILFPDKGSTLGNYFMNSVKGLRDPAAIKRDGISALALFNRRNGEVHDMGEAYASIWWEVWDKHYKAQTNRDLEIIFTNHLGGMDDSDTFSTALEVIREMARQIFPEKAPQIIADFETEYSRMGVTIL